MIRLLTLIIMWPTLTFASSGASIDGTLFKKEQKWFLFVQSEDASFKKGTIELKDIPTSEKKFLIEKAYVRIFGVRASCGPAMCLTVKTIKPTLFDPLKSRKK